MSKPWKPAKQTVELRPSRIRREPVRPEKKVEPPSREREILGGVTGVLLVAFALTAIIVGISVITYSNYSATGTRSRQFGHCYNDSGPNCVVDGDTIYVAGERVEIAGMDVPQIQAARCPDERSRGIEAAVRLVTVLNRGRVKVAPAVPEGEVQGPRAVEVGGKDVATAMIKSGVARRIGDKPANWCSPRA